MRPHSAFVRAVAAEERTVLHKRGAKPLPRGGDRRAHAGEATAHHDEIIHAAGRDLERGTPWPRIALCKAERVDPPLESGQVAKPHLRRPGDANRPAVFPVPGALADAELLRRPAADLDTESAGALRRDPVACAHEEPPFALLAEVHRRDGVCDRLADSMRKEIGGAHPVHELLVDHPPADRLERLRFNENLAVRGGG